MSPSIAQFPLLISSILLVLISIPTNVAASSSLIQFACSGSQTIDAESCLAVLESIPKISSAKNLYNLSVAIIESGIANATDTRRHLLDVKGAPEDCRNLYDQVVARFSGALLEVKQSEFLAATYSLLTASTDYIKPCETASAKQNFRDEIVARGNRAVPIFGLSANTVVGELDLRSQSPPPRGN